MGLIANEVPVSGTSSGVAEEIVWRGTSSQWKNFGVYLICGLFCWLIVPVFFALVYYLQTRCKGFANDSAPKNHIWRVYQSHRNAGIVSGERYRNAATVFFATRRHRECPDDYIRRVVAICFDRSCAIERWVRGQITQSGRNHSPAKTGT
jgi:hypothetical protein